MTLRPRIKHSLLVVACACAALAASLFANSQSPATATQPEQAAQSAPQAQADEKPGFGDNPIERRMAYSSFLKLMDYEERQRQLELDSSPVKHSAVVGWVKILGIREDEEQVMRTIVADAYGRIKEMDDQVNATGMQNRQNPSAENQERFQSLIKKFAGQGDEILDQTIAKLRQELGEEDFKKLDDYIYRDSPAGMAAAKRRANAPNPQQSGGSSDSAPAKVPQP